MVADHAPTLRRQPGKTAGEVVIPRPSGELVNAHRHNHQRPAGASSRSAQLEFCWRTDVIGGGIYSVVDGSFEVRFSLVVVVAPWGMWRRWRRSQAAARLRPVSLNLAGQEGVVFFLLGF